MNESNEINIKVKKNYLTKLTKNLTSKGVLGRKVDEIVTEVSSSVDEYFLDKEVRNLAELEENFGKTEYFSREYKEQYSLLGEKLQKLFTICIFICLLIVPAFSVSTFFVSPYKELISGNGATYSALAFISTEAAGFVPLTAVFSSGFGAYGALLGLNVGLGFLSKLFKNSFPKYDARRKVAFVCIIVEYWLLVVIWFILALIPYLLVFNYIGTAWNNGLRWIILEGIVRWILLGVYLVISAIIYTKRIKEVINNSSEFSDAKKYRIMNNEISIFTILAVFIISNPGVGLLVPLLGGYVLISGKLSGKTWFLGLGANVIQIIQLITETAKYPTFGVFPVYGTTKQAVFGIPITLGAYGSHDWHKSISRSFNVAIIILLLWTTIGLWILKKKKERIVPRFNFQNLKRKGVSLALLIIVIGATLGSRSNFTRRYGRTGYLLEDDMAYSEVEIYVPTAGIVYIQVYWVDGVNISWEVQVLDSYDNDVMDYWEGNPLDNEVQLWQDEIVLNFRSQFIVIEVDGPAVIIFTAEEAITYNLHESIPNNIPLVGAWMDVESRSVFPWFSGWSDLAIFILTLLFFVLEWKKTENEEGGEMFCIKCGQKIELENGSQKEEI